MEKELPPVFVITMPERRRRVEDHLQKVGLSYRMFPAFDGKNLGVQSKNPYLDDHDAAYWSKNQPFFCGSGIHGLFLTWIALVKMGLMLGYEEMLILEDDVELPLDFLEKFSRCREELPSDYKMLYGGACCMDAKGTMPYSPSLIKGHPLCTHCVLVSRSAMQEIEARAVLGMPVDIFFLKKIFPSDGVHVSSPSIAEQLSYQGLLPTTLS